MRFIILLIPLVGCAMLLFQPEFVKYVSLFRKPQPSGLKDAPRAFLLAAEMGDASAVYNLGLLYDRGDGVLQSYVQAYRWYNLASARGDVEAARARDLLAASMTPSQIAEGQKLSHDWEIDHPA